MESTTTRDGRRWSERPKAPFFRLTTISFSSRSSYNNCERSSRAAAAATTRTLSHRERQQGDSGILRQQGAANSGEENMTGTAGDE